MASEEFGSGMRKRSDFLWISLAVYLLLGGGFILFTQDRHRQHEEEKRNKLAEEQLATAEEIRRRAEIPELPFEIEETRMIPSGERHWLIELTIRYANDEGEPRRLGNPFAALRNGENQLVPEFFLAFAEPPVVEPAEERVVKLRYWWEGEKPAAGLWLRVGQDEVEVPL